MKKSTTPTLVSKIPTLLTAALDQPQSVVPIVAAPSEPPRAGITLTIPHIIEPKKPEFFRRLDPGLYEFSDVDDDDDGRKHAEKQRIQFIERLPSKLVAKSVKPRMATEVDGVAVEAVLAACLDRLMTYQKRLPSIQGLLAAHHLELAIAQLLDRTRDRTARDVEGTPLP